MSGISPKQIAIIHTIKSHLKMADDSYHAMLESFGVSTSRALTSVQAAELIDTMNSLSARLKVNGPQTQVKTPGKKYDDLGDRPGMATPGQLRLVEFTWSQVSRQVTSLDRAKALRSFMARIVGIEEIIWLEPNHIRKLVAAMRSMQRQAAARREV
jgi:phage gp16-like protein